MNKRKVMKTTFIILLFTIAVIGGSNQAAQALYYNSPTSNEEVQEVESNPTGEVGIQQTADTIDIWIVQEYEIAIYDLAYIECHVLSLYAIDIDALIEVWIQYSNGSTFLIYTETRVLHPMLEYVFTVTHAFTSLGYHLVNLKVMDLTHDQEVTTECEWYVYDGYLEIAIIQHYEAQVGIEVSMDIYVYNGYAIEKDFYIEVRIDNGTHNIQIFETTKTIAAYDTYIVTIFWTFTWADYYDVILHVLDLAADLDWYDYCYFMVYDGFVDIIIEQNYEAWIGIEERIQIWVYNYYLIDITVNIEVWVDNGTLTYMIYQKLGEVIVYGTYFMDEIFYTFLYEGIWDLHVDVYVIELDTTWIEYCPEGWIVFGGYFDVWIYQRYEVFVLEEAVMYCWILNNYAVDRDIAIEVWISNATHDIMIYGESYNIAAGELYNFTVYWTFYYVDYWDVKLLVLDIVTDIYYVDYCYWYVYGGYFELFIYQEYFALVDELVWIEIEVINYYAVDKDITVEVLIFDGVSYESIYFLSLGMSPFAGLTGYVQHTFDTAGYYDVILVVTELDTGLVWLEYCWWEIYIEYLDVWIIQDYKAQVGEEVNIEFYIFNYYLTDVTVNIEVWINNGTYSDLVYGVSGVTIPALTVYNFSISHTFLNPGLHTVTIRVIQSATGGLLAEEHCHWKVYLGYIDVWIIQEYQAVVGQEVWMAFYAQSYYSFDVPIYVEVRIDTGNGTVILYSNTLTILAFQLLFWNLSYTFLNPGLYQIYFIVVELQTGLLWMKECRWKVSDDGYFDLWIEQGYYGEVNVEYEMQFGVGNYYSIDKNLTIVVKIVKGPNEWILYNVTMIVTAMTTHSFYVYWTPTELGWYDVYLIVTDNTTGLVYVKDCWWKIEDAVVVPEFNAMTLLPILTALSAAVYLALRKKRKLKN
jgi:hypothetical protein